jgi:hypothetical protein
MSSTTTESSISLLQGILGASIFCWPIFSQQGVLEAVNKGSASSSHISTVPTSSSPMFSISWSPEGNCKWSSNCLLVRRGVSWCSRWRELRRQILVTWSTLGSWCLSWMARYYSLEMIVKIIRGDWLP